MSERDRRPGAARQSDACERYTPTLAMLDADVDALLRGAEREAALDHLADCARCQADQRAYARLDDDLRRAFGPGSPATAPLLRTSDLLAAIGATREPAAMPRWAAEPRRDVIRSVIYLGDFDGGFEEGVERMSEQEPREEPREERAGDEAALVRQAERPERRMAAIPSLRPAPRRLGSQAWAMGFGATAVAVVLIVVAATLFASRPRAIPTQTAHSGATQTAASAQGAAGAGPLGPMADVAMVSPTDGWALGDATEQPINSEQQAVVALYHYDGSQWRLAQKVKGFMAYGGARASLTMLSATDGWAFDGTPNLLHYDGTTWRVTGVTVSGTQPVGGLLAFDMVSPTEGWAAAYLNNGASGVAAIGFLRYNGQQWTVDQSGFALPANLDPATVNIVGIAAAPGSDPWAIGWANIKGATPTPAYNNPSQAGFALHRVNGVWQLENQFPLPGGATSMMFNEILMTGPASGWIVGQTAENRTQIGGAVVSITQPLLLRYDGSSWSAVVVPQDVTQNDGTLQQIVESGPDNIWVVVNTNGSTIGANGVAVSATFLHYDGATWSEVTPTLNVAGVNSVSVNSIGLAPNGDLWAVGVATKKQGQQWMQSPFFCQYANGAWNVVTPATSGK